MAKKKTEKLPIAEYIRCNADLPLEASRIVDNMQVKKQPIKSVLIGHLLSLALTGESPYKELSEIKLPKL